MYPNLEVLYTEYDQQTEEGDKEKVKRITKNMSASKARSVRQAVKKQGGRLATGGRAKGGLMKRSSK